MLPIDLGTMLSTSSPPGTHRRPLPWPDAVGEVCARPALVRTVFQPIVDIQRGAVSGFEMLARFPAARGASPPEWFAAAREHGVGDLLEARLLRTGLATREALPPNCFLTVNLSPEAAVSDEVAAVLDEAGRLDLVVIEVTEQSAVEDYGTLGRTLERLRDLGAAIAVDDAGAGYASLQHIMRLRPEFIKLDRELVAGLDTDPPKVALVEAMGSFASRIDAWIVAEGIERRGELDALRALRVPLGQGFGLGRPDASFSAAPGDLLPGLALRTGGPGGGRARHAARASGHRAPRGEPLGARCALHAGARRRGASRRAPGAGAAAPDHHPAALPPRRGPGRSRPPRHDPSGRGPPHAPGLLRRARALPRTALRRAGRLPPLRCRRPPRKD